MELLPPAPASPTMRHSLPPSLCRLVLHFSHVARRWRLFHPATRCLLFATQIWSGG